MEMCRPTRQRYRKNISSDWVWIPVCNSELYLGSMDILYKLLTCYNKSTYETDNSLTGGFNGGHLNESLTNLISKFARPYHLLISCS